jgi:sugar-specific transcriptional regulator TrmB
MVLGKLEESHKQLQDEITNLKRERISDSVPEDLLRMSKQIPEIISLIKEVSQSNTKMQYSTMMTLQGIQRHLIGRHLDLFKISLRSP